MVAVEEGPGSLAVDAVQTAQVNSFHLREKNALEIGACSFNDLIQVDAEHPNHCLGSYFDLVYDAMDRLFPFNPFTAWTRCKNNHTTRSKDLISNAVVRV